MLHSSEHVTALDQSRIRANPTLQESRAIAVIVAAPKGHDVLLINCQEEECTWPVSTPATMIGYEAGQQLLVGVSSLVLLLLLLHNRQLSADLLPILHCMRQSLQAALPGQNCLDKNSLIH